MLRVLPWLILPVAAEEACRARVAHCIVGHVRTFWQEAVYQSIADVLVPRASPPHCADFFYVLSLSSNSDTSKGGLYEYNETLLWSTAWKILPPTKYLFDPPAPNPKHSSYHQPDCLFQCVHMFDKVRLCMDLVRKHESESGKTYQWILRSRPDLLWQDETVLPPLHELADTHIYMPITRDHMKDTVCKDPVQIVPRNLADVFFDNIMDKCLLRRDMDGAVWNCDQWIRRFCESKGIPFTLLKLAAVIKRLPNIKDDFFDYHDQWFQHIQFAQQLFPDSIHILGNEDEKLVFEHEKKWSLDSRAIPDGLEPKEGCKTVADSQFCMPSNAYLMHLRFAINTSALRTLKEVDFGVWRTYPRNIRDLGGRNSRFLKNASHFWFKVWFPEVYDELSETSGAESHFHYNLWTPVLLRRGDCIFWTSCSRKSVGGFRHPNPRRLLSSESQILAFASGGLPAAPRMKETVGPFHVMPSRYHSAAFTFIKQKPAV